MAGYSGTPLARKLGLRPGLEVATIGAPENYRNLLEPVPGPIEEVPEPRPSTDLIHLFTKRRSELEARLRSLRATMRPDAVLWVSWPKRSAGVETDVTEDVIRDVALPLGLVDVKVCAIDAVWSGLKLVIRKERR